MYEQFFGLEEEPFRLTPDPRFLYLSPKHAEALAHLRLCLTESSGFVCITGDVGAGKTTLLRAFLAELGPNVDAAYTYVPPLTTVELLKRVCREFKVVAASDQQGDLVDALHEFLIAQRAAGRLSVVVLDEAQALSPELLEQVRLLLNLETATDKLLRIVLVGQPQLSRLLLDPELAQLNQRITLRWHLGPLSYREMVAYVRHRLAVASNGRANELLTVPALRLLYRRSGGIPRLVNMLTHRALLTAYVNREGRVRRKSMLAAYREIQSVPLPGTVSWVARRTSLAVAGATVGLALLAIGAPRLEWPGTGPVPVDARSAPAFAEATCDAPDAVVVAEPVEATPPPATVAVAAVPIAPRALTAGELRARLAKANPDEAVRSSTNALLAAWEAPELGGGEPADPSAIEAVAWRRDLQALTFTANRSMLRLLDLPAQLKLQAPGFAPRYATLRAVDGLRLVLDVAGEPYSIDAADLDTLWSGEARLVWRDFGSLGTLLARGTRGVAVMSLQELLGRAGVLNGPPNGLFDEATERAVIDFQRAHQLEADGRVGPFTRVVLYNAVGGYERPTLAPATGVVS